MIQFAIYTYQFSPVPIQGSLFINSYMKDVMMNKNILFRELITSIPFVYRNKSYSTRFLQNKDDIIVFQIANTKDLFLEKDFQKETMVNEPSSLIIINNNSNVQRILVQKNTLAFTDTDVLVRIVSRSLKKELARKGLSLTIKREYENKEFWKIVNDNSCLITMVRFEFDYPNLPRVSQKISDLIKGLSEDSYSSKTKFELNSSDGSHLNINKSNADIENMVLAASSSGNPITLKIKGIKKHVKTGNDFKSVEIDRLDIEANKWDDINKLFKEINEG